MGVYYTRSLVRGDDEDVEFWLNKPMVMLFAERYAELLFEKATDSNVELEQITTRVLQFTYRPLGTQDTYLITLQAMNERRDFERLLEYVLHAAYDHPELCSDRAINQLKVLPIPAQSRQGFV